MRFANYSGHTIATTKQYAITNMNKVELIGHYGSDIVHAQSAWTSTYRDLTEDKLSRIDKLLGFLAKEGHHTPFEKSTLHFLVNVDQATHIHLLKHRIGVSINGESARYKELKEDKHYLPEDWTTYAATQDLHTSLVRLQVETDALYHTAIERLVAAGFDRSRAKESARYFKLMSSQITMDISFNFRSFYHFLNLRNKPDAQLEVRELAAEMLKQVKELPGNPFKHTIKAFRL